MAETDLSTWLTVDDAGAAIGCSKRTVERLASAKKLEQRLRRQEGTPPVAVYNPDDVARLASERHPTPPPFVLDAVRTGNGNGHRKTSLPDPAFRDSTALARPDPGILVALTTGLAEFAAVLRTFAPESPPSPPVAEKVAERRRPRVEDLPSYVPLDLAMAYSGLSERYLRKMIKLGTVTAIRDDRQWKIHKKDVVAIG
jgi:hypothetical protein